MQTKSLFSRQGILVILIVLAMLVAGCGGGEADQPAETQGAGVAETEAPPAEAQSAEVAATEAAPAVAPANPVQLAASFTHSSGQFQIQPTGEKLDELYNGAFFRAPNGLELVAFKDSSDALDDSTVANAMASALDSYLGQASLATDYSLDGAPAAFAGGYLAKFQARNSDGSPIQGSLYLRKDGGLLYTVLLLTSDYAAAEQAIQQSIQSLVPAASVDPSTATADSGFRPDKNGFKFENYTGKEFPVTNLTPAEMERMFGPQVCANKTGGECTLTPPAKRWMDDRNDGMSGGHCEGFTVLGSLMYYGQVDPNPFGGSSAHDLQIKDNEALQREIAYWFITQYTQPGGVNKINESPKAVVEALMQVFKDGKQAGEEYAVGIYQRGPKGGHSVLPIGVVDKGGGLYDILVYDNNYPDQTRAIAVDANANTWQYEFATNPNEKPDIYEGDASSQTLEVVSITPRIGEQVCDFCSTATGGHKAGSGVNAVAPEFYEVTLEGPASLLIQTEDGKRIGYIDGQFVNEVEGANAMHPKLGADGPDLEPVYRVPAGKTFAISVDAAGLTDVSTNTVSVIGPGFFMAVEDIVLDAGEIDQIGITSEGKTYAVLYKTNYTETPEIYMGIETPQADYAFLASAHEMTGQDDTLNIVLDLENQLFAVSSEGNTDPSKYDFYVLRIDDESESAFGTVDFQLEPRQTVYLDYSKWPGNSTPMTAQLDTNSDGVPDQNIELPDTSDEFIW